MAGARVPPGLSRAILCFGKTCFYNPPSTWKLVTTTDTLRGGVNILMPSLKPYI